MSSRRCRDIGYEFLTSIESGWSVDWKWGKRALCAVLASILFAAISIALPAYIVQGANSLSDYSNSLVGQMTSAIIPSSYQGLSGFDFSLAPGVQGIVPVVDFSGPAGSISVSVASAFTSLTTIAAALAVLCLVAFVIQIKRVLILKTPVDKHLFYYGQEQEKEVVELIKILRAEAGIKNTKFRRA